VRARGETAGSPAIDADGPTAVIPAVVFSAIGARTPPTRRELIGEVGRSDPILGDVLREQNAGHPQLAPNPDGGNAVSTAGLAEDAGQPVRGGPSDTEAIASFGHRERVRQPSHGASYIHVIHGGKPSSSGPSACRGLDGTERSGAHAAIRHGMSDVTHFTRRDGCRDRSIGRSAA